MIILDTNVVSELMKASPSPAVVAWLDRQPVDSIWLTSITVFEVRFGLALLASGKRRRALESAFDEVLEEELEHRVLEFDAVAALPASTLAATRQKAGRPVDLRDTLIAGIATARRATLATRNLRHFSDLKVPVVDPWAA